MVLNLDPCQAIQVEFTVPPAARRLPLDTDINGTARGRGGLARGYDDLASGRGGLRRATIAGETVGTLNF